MRISTIGRGAIPATGTRRRRIRLTPRTVRGRATAVVTLMTALALAASAGVLLYAVRHELVGTALTEANTTTTPPETGSPGPDTTVAAVPDFTEVPAGDLQDSDIILIDAAQDTLVRLMGSPCSSCW
jgi:hypothetical protein